MKKEIISNDKYAADFCHEVRMRKVIYVSREMHRKLRRIAHLFRDSHVTLSSLADAILAKHFTTYDALIETLWQESYEEFLSDWPVKKKDDSDDEEGEEDADE